MLFYKLIYSWLLQKLHPQLLGEHGVARHVEQCVVTYKDGPPGREARQCKRGQRASQSSKKGFTQCQFVHMEVTHAKHSCLCSVCNDLHGMATGFTMVALLGYLSEVGDYGATKCLILHK